jgi:hypothetical protein
MTNETDTFNQIGVSAGREDWGSGELGNVPESCLPEGPRLEQRRVHDDQMLLRKS